MKNMASMISDMKDAINAQATAVPRPANKPSHVPECNTYILIAGGHDGKDYLNSTEMFNFATKTWTTLGDMKDSRLAASAFVYQNNVIVAGGFNGDTSTNRMEGIGSFWTSKIEIMER